MTVVIYNYACVEQLLDINYACVEYVTRIFGKGERSMKKARSCDEKDGRNSTEFMLRIVSEHRDKVMK